MSKRLIPMVARATRTIVRPAAPVAQAAAIRSFSFAAAWPLDGACRKPAAAAVAKFAHQVKAGRTSGGERGKRDRALREKQMVCTQWLPPLPTTRPQFAVGELDREEAKCISPGAARCASR